ncbi:hypothetical protein [Kribbella sp. NPDC000426]|uniref:hypothetical protein n=1 Tax=Kribbella sp. NPDC000426 TaxID=3154255 RepID=UPI00331ADB12
MDWEDVVAHSASLEGWLSRQQPSGAERPNWWLGWVLVSGGKIQSVVSSGDVPDTATLDRVVRVLNAAANEGAVAADDVAIRLANLAGLIAKAGAVVGQPLELRPDVAARRCLQLIPQDIAQVELAATRWRSLPIAEIRALRRVKNLVNPTIRLAPFLSDREFVDHVGKWNHVLPQLP